MAPGPYSQNFIFFITYEWAQQARALDYTMPERLANDKHSSLFGTLESYKENEL